MQTTTTHRWLLIALLLAAFALRAYNLGTQELRGDEAFSWLFANRPLVEIVPFLIEEADPHPPLHYLQVGAWLQLTGESEYALRYVSALAGLLLLPAMWRLGGWVAGRRLGMLLVLLTAVSPSLIWLSQDVRNQYTFAMLFTTLATVVLVQQVAKWSLASTGQRSMVKFGRAFVVPYGVLAALAMYSHYYAVFALLAHGLFLLFVPAHRRFLPAWVTSGVGAFVLFLPWVWVMLFRLAGKQLADPSTPEFAIFLTQIGVELSLGRGVTTVWWARWVFLILAGVAALGGWALFKKHPQGNAPPLPAGAGILFVSWLLLTAVGIFLILFRRSTFNAFYVTVAAPAWLMLIGVGLLVLWQKGRGWRGLSGLILLGWMLTTAVSLNQQYFDTAVSKTWGYRDMTAHLAREVEPATDVFIAHFPDPSFDYYLRDIPLPRTIAPRYPDQPPAETRAQLAQLAAEYDRLWFVPAHRSGWDPEDIAYEWLEFETLREQMATYQRLDLLAYRPTRTLPQVAHPVQRTLRDELTLQQAFVTVNGVPADLTQPLRLTPGDTLRVTLNWEALSDVGESYTAFVHLLGADGLMVTQHDGIPVNGQRPTLYWQTGQSFLDTHELNIPLETAVENGTLFVGLYNTQSLERQTFADGLDSWPLATLSISNEQ